MEELVKFLKNCKGHYIIFSTNYRESLGRKFLLSDFRVLNDRVQLSDPFGSTLDLLYTNKISVEGDKCVLTYEKSGREFVKREGKGYDRILPPDLIIELRKCH